jgi:hypothetical protein
MHVPREGEAVRPPDRAPTGSSAVMPRTLRHQTYDPRASLRAILRERECRIPNCGHPPGGCHHLIPKGAPHFGDDVLANLIPLCGSGTTGHHGRIEAYDAPICALLGTALTDENIAYVLGHLGPGPGREFLSRRYYRDAIYEGSTS